jgi:hypothetical protein
MVMASQMFNGGPLYLGQGEDGKGGGRGPAARKGYPRLGSNGV